MINLHKLFGRAGIWTRDLGYAVRRKTSTKLGIEFKVMQHLLRFLIKDASGTLTVEV